MRVAVAADSFDTPHFGCTTHFMSLLALHLISKGFKIVDYPALIRLNPAIPWKTRGNASVRLTVDVDDVTDLKRNIEEFLDIVNPLYKKGYLVITKYQETFDIYLKSISEVLDPLVVRNSIKDIILDEWGETNVGALVASVTPSSALRNYELIVYSYDVIDIPNEVCDVICHLEEVLWPLLHENCHNDKCIAVPKAGKPVLIGIRGSHPCVLASLLPLLPGWSHATLFKTNQHSILLLPPSHETFSYEFKTLHIRTTVKRLNEDVMIDNLMLFNESGITRKFRGTEFFDGVVSVILKGDVGSIAALKGKIISLSKRAPRCPRCGGRMKSKGKGVRVCKRCGFKAFVPTWYSFNVSDITLTPVAGRKLHLVGEYSGIPERCSAFYISVN